MKKVIISLMSIVLCGTALAHLPKWVIAPEYDRLQVKVDNCLLETESAGTTALWTMDGKCIFKTNDHVNPFQDGVAVITMNGNDDLIGVVDTLGKFIAVPNIRVAYDYPFFENGYLTCQDSKGYSYYKKDGSKAEFPQSVRSYPFYHGFAPFFTYRQFEKKKDPHYGYFTPDAQEIEYIMIEKGKAKEIEPKDINFLSGIGDNNRGIAVIKNKLYLFNPDTRLFEPFLYGDNESEKKRHLVLNDIFEDYFINLPIDTLEFMAKNGDDKFVTLKFDQKLRPVSIILDNEKQTFVKPKPQDFKYVSYLKPFSDNSKFGFDSNSKETRKLLPPQFEEIGLIYGTKAFVKHNGKWGVIEIVPKLKYSLKLNKGEDIAFRHQKFETQIRLDLPPEISAEDARIDIPVSSGCVIDKTSRETKDTESGNYVVYNCTLNIPETLPDTITSISYSPVSISLDGIRLFNAKINTKAWHLKHYNVDPIESETSISNGVASFTININSQKNVGENDYPFEVKVEADSVFVEYEKISETRYKCMVSNLQEGTNNLNISVTEKGCPPSVFPFEVYYTKPVPKKKKQEAVVVRKKSSQAGKPATRIEL